MARSQFYYKELSAVNIDGIVAEFGGPDNFYAIARNEGASTIMGVNRPMTQVSVDPRATLSLQIFGISPTNDQLERIWVSQSTGAARFFDITVITGENEAINLHRCMIEKPPEVSGGGPAQQSRTWQFTVEEYNPDKSNF